MTKSVFLISYQTASGYDLYNDGDYYEDVANMAEHNVTWVLTECDAYAIAAIRKEVLDEVVAEINDEVPDDEAVRADEFRWVEDEYERPWSRSEKAEVRRHTLFGKFGDVHAVVCVEEKRVGL